MRYQKLLKFDMNNGPGCRVTIWVSGCDLNCKNCFNQEAQNPDAGELFTEDTMDEIIKALEPDHIQGFTFLGGDPMYKTNYAPVVKIAKRIKEVYGNKKDIWMWSGYTYEKIAYNIVRDRIDTDGDIFDYIDVLIDGPFVEDLKDPALKYAGSSNQRIMKVFNEDYVDAYDMKTDEIERRYDRTRKHFKKPDYASMTEDELLEAAMDENRGFLYYDEDDFKE